MPTHRGLPLATNHIVAFVSQPAERERGGWGIECHISRADMAAPPPLDLLVVRVESVL